MILKRFGAKGRNVLCSAGQSQARVSFIQNERIRRFAVNITRCWPSTSSSPLLLMTMKWLFAFHEIFSISRFFFFRSMLHLLACAIHPKNSSVLFTNTHTNTHKVWPAPVLPLHFRISFVCRASGLILGQIAPLPTRCSSSAGSTNVAKTTRYVLLLINVAGTSRIARISNRVSKQERAMRAEASASTS